MSDFYQLLAEVQVVEARAKSIQENPDSEPAGVRARILMHLITATNALTCARPIPARVLEAGPGLCVRCRLHRIVDAEGVCGTCR